ncbi:hypothetical protein JNB88_10360 [Rhizobium cauense]|uniref:hypothetical protein n=1 Tax=Rhizobium cauense TaxID=1166683 RepID=UPI001C6E75C4|nr:hypothetical protein [Rhizobium cauense]MBW9114040.1 hypothetical protein [Rhizobium cauense]
MPGVRKTITLSAFDVDESGTLIPAFEPMQMRAEETAVYLAETMVNDHIGVLVVEQISEPGVGEVGDTIILFRYGRTPDIG